MTEVCIAWIEPEGAPHEDRGVTAWPEWDFYSSPLPSVGDEIINESHRPFSAEEEEEMEKDMDYDSSRYDRVYAVTKRRFVYNRDGDLTWVGIDAVEVGLQSTLPW